MGRTKKVGPTRGLGVRYGVSVRKRYIRVVTELKRPHACPQCGLPRVKRESIGVWKCRKCGYTFTGGAYVPTTKLGVIAKRVARGAPPEEALKRVEAEAPEEETV